MNTVLPRAPWVFTAFFPAVVPGWSLVETFKNISIPALLTKVPKPQLCVSIIYKTFCYFFFNLIWVKEKEKKETNSVDEETKAAPWSWKETLSIYERLPDTEKV